MRAGKLRRVKFGALLVGGLLLGGSPCVSAQMGRELATNTTSTIANLLIDAIVVQPFQEVIDQHVGAD